jgi:hypothetical protein
MAQITSHFDISSSSVLRGGRRSHSNTVIGSGYFSRISWFSHLSRTPAGTTSSGCRRSCSSIN